MATACLECTIDGSRLTERKGHRTGVRGLHSFQAYGTVNAYPWIVLNVKVPFGQMNWGSQKEGGFQIKIITDKSPHCQKRSPGKYRLSQCKSTFDRWLWDSDFRWGCTYWGRTGDVMTGDMTHLLPLGCLGWPRCLTESCRLLLHLNPISLVFPSLCREWQRETKEKSWWSWRGLFFQLLKILGTQAYSICKHVSITQAIWQLNLEGLADKLTLVGGNPRAQPSFVIT